MPRGSVSQLVEPPLSGGTLVLRMLGAENKEDALLASIEAIRRDEPDPCRYTIDLLDFRSIPNAPFCYWVSDRIRRLFSELQPLESESRNAIAGLQTSNDDRFIRQAWEVPAAQIGPDEVWVICPKSEPRRAFYTDWSTVVRWGSGGRALRSTGGSPLSSKAYIRNENLYFQPAIAWVRRTARLSLRAVPEGTVLSDSALSVHVPEADLLPTLALLNSLVADYLIKLSVGRTGDSVQFMPGMLSNLPWPELSQGEAEELGALARRGWRLQRELDTVTLTSHAFVLPELLQGEGASLRERARQWAARVGEVEDELAGVRVEIDDRAFELYGLGPEDRQALAEGPAGLSSGSDEKEGDGEEEPDEAALASRLVSWLVGVAFGRFDVRFATGDVEAPEAPEPFDALPPCAPGILVGAQGLPATEGDIATASFLSARPDAATYPDAERHEQPRITASGYPVRVAWDGILVEDPGLSGESAADADLLRRTREAMEVIWGGRARDIEEELAEMLGVSDLRDYLTRHTQFFHQELRRYTRTRKAPIYWSLSTESGSYTVWLYYPRLSDDTLYRAVSEHVEPKLTSVDRKLTRVAAELDQLEGREAAQRSSELAELKELKSELEDLRDELVRVAELPYRPSLNDGVEINGAPLWRLFPHRQWRRRMKKEWKRLKDGKRDWAHLASVLWPERVREACRRDQSLAIAHDLEKLHHEGS